jgi:hypothetical protein
VTVFISPHPHLLRVRRHPLHCLPHQLLELGCPPPPTATAASLSNLNAPHGLTEILFGDDPQAVQTELPCVQLLIWNQECLVPRKYTSIASFRFVTFVASSSPFPVLCGMRLLLPFLHCCQHFFVFVVLHLSSSSTPIHNHLNQGE